MDKAIMDMATRSWSPSVRNLLVQLLNGANSEVRDAHESAEGKAMKNDISASRDGGLLEIPIDAKFDENQRLPTTVKDDYDLGPGFEASSDIDRSKASAPGEDAQTIGDAQYAAEVAFQERFTSVWRGGLCLSPRYMYVSNNAVDHKDWKLGERSTQCLAEQVAARKD